LNPFAKLTAGIGILGIIVALVFLLSCIGAAILFFGWNLGVVALVAACGGHVAKIGFWTAYFVSLALSVVKGIFSGVATK
jgi:hypothetical protein